MSQTDIGERIAKHRIERDTADKLRALFTEDVSGFLDEVRKGCVEAMVAAPIDDDEARRRAAMYLQILADFRSHMQREINKGVDAQRQIEKLESRNHD